jgi:hypothetical protein
MSKLGWDVGVRRAAMPRVLGGTAPPAQDPDNIELDRSLREDELDPEQGARDSSSIEVPFFTRRLNFEWLSEAEEVF